MTKPRVLSIASVVVLICVPIFLFAGDSSGYPCYTARESKRRGCFVCAAAFSPNEIKWKGKSIVIAEAWVERSIEKVGPLRLLPVYRTKPGYKLCFNLSQGWDVLNTMNGPFFALEKSGHSFSTIGTVVLCEELENLDRREFTVLCSDGFKDDKDGVVRIKVVLKLPPQPTKTGSDLQ
jgi:hypothetical protein